IYGTRNNRAYLKSKDIRFSGKPPGRPPKENDANKSELKEKREKARQGEIDRIPIEGKFGQGKRKYGLDLIKAKLSSTSETWIAMIFLVLNLEKWLSKVGTSLLEFFCLFLSPRTLLWSIWTHTGGRLKSMFIAFAMKSYGYGPYFIG
ncbi:MAG: transposase, partial [Kiritimatiellaeota bacterium]|nr:transposase [Kiritimatiellota bacterium]